MEMQAFVLRIAPGGEDMVPKALEADQLIIGWSQAKELLDPALDWKRFRKVLADNYYPNEGNLRRAGAAAGHMSRFIREMNEGDLVVVPHGPVFYVAEVAGPAVYLDDKVEEDTAFRRDVCWLNDKQPIPRKLARSKLISRMKTQGTCAYATDLLDEIRDALEAAARDSAPSFETDLKDRLVAETLKEIREGRLDDFRFEALVKTVLEALGAEEATIVPRSKDKGADVVGTFHLAGAFPLKVAVQAKHWRPDPPVSAGVVEELIRGIDAEDADLGMVMTSGSIGEDAIKRAEEYALETGKKLQLIDGEQLATLIVENGILGE